MINDHKIETHNDTQHWPTRLHNSIHNVEGRKEPHLY